MKFFENDKMNSEIIKKLLKLPYLCLYILGLMITSALLYHFLHFLHFTLHIREVCVFLAPLFSSFTVIVTYLLTREIKVIIYLLFIAIIIYCYYYITVIFKLNYTFLSYKFDKV